MKVDVLIVGGGLVGNALAIALANTELTVALVEAKAIDERVGAHLDARSIALSLSSSRILNGLKLWSDLAEDASPIKSIHVSEKGQFQATRLSACDHHLDEFGHVVEIHHLNRVLQKHLLKAQSTLNYFCPASLKALTKTTEGVTATVMLDSDEDVHIEASVLVAADGANSMVRKLLNITHTQKAYHQSAIVCNVALKRSHHDRAYERFTKTGLMAMLPMRQHRQALVWAMPETEAKTTLELDKKHFLENLQQAFGYRLGRFCDVGKPGMFPLSLNTMDKSVYERVVFVGNAQHSLHPIAGQGLNLGLRDVAMLAQCLNAMSVEGVDKTLQDYETLRQQDIHQTTRLTHQLVKVFSSPLWGLSLVKHLGLFSFETIPVLKDALVTQAMGFSKHNSRLASGLPL